MDWTEKYRPETLSAVRGNDSARRDLEEWADTWEDHRQAVILHGNPGVGKTTAAHALASDRGWAAMELNASDDRKADVIQRVAGEAARTGTLTAGGGGRRLVILDEADNFHGTVDYGGTREVTRVVKSAAQPMVLIANEFYDMSQGLRSACEAIEFRDLSPREVLPVLRDICRREDVSVEEGALEAIAEDAAGDVRSAINDLQAVAERTETLRTEDVVTGSRDRGEGIFEFLDAAIKERGPKGALEAAYDVDETPDDLIAWIEENMPKDYEGAELAAAYDHLATADRWLGRVRKTQEYTYWRYATDAMVAGVAAARGGPKGGWTRYGPPSYWSKLGRSRARRDTRDAIAQRIAEREGTSLGTARREVMPFLATMTHHCRNRDLTVAMAAAYDLDEAEVAFVTGSGEDTDKVAGIVEAAHSGGASLTVSESETDPDRETEEGGNDGQAGLGDFT